MWARYIEGRDDGMVAIIVMTTDPAVGVMGHKGAGMLEETENAELHEVVEYPGCRSC